MAPLFSQTQFSGWLASFNTVKLGKKTSLHADFQLRSTDDVEHVQTILLRSGLNFHVTKKLVLTAGYAYIRNKAIVSTVHGFVPEHRAWEQILFNHKLKNIFVTHRLRIEQRFIATTEINNNEIDVNDYSVSNRVRYFFRNVLPFRHSETFKKGPFAALQNEVFANVTGKDKVNGKFFDQNRLYLALGYRLKPSVDLEIGYLNQYVSRKVGRLNNHVLQVAGYLRL